MSSLRVVTPGAQPLPVERLRLHCRVDHTEEDALLVGYQAAAVRLIVEATGRPIGSTRYILSLNDFPDYELLLPRPGVTAIHEVRYWDSDDVEQTLATFRSDLYREPAELWPALNESWPATVDKPGAVEVEYSSGSTLTDPLVTQAILLLVSTWYENRETDVTGTIVSKLPSGFDRLIAPLRFRSEKLIRQMEMY